MVLRRLLLLFLLSVSSLGISQSIERASFFSTSGNYADVGSIALQSNIGELMTDSYAGSSNVLFQGFIQPDPIITTFIAAIDHNNIRAYPNPASDQMLIEFPGVNDAEMSLEVFDVLGNILIKMSPSGYTDGKIFFILNMRSMSSGIYMAAVHSFSQKINKTFRITKI